MEDFGGLAAGLPSFEEMDLNRDGLVDRHEFAQAMAGANPEFQQADTQQPGYRPKESRRGNAPGLPNDLPGTVPMPSQVTGAASTTGSGVPLQGGTTPLRSSALDLLQSQGEQSGKGAMENAFNKAVNSAFEQAYAEGQGRQNPRISEIQSDAGIAPQGESRVERNLLEENERKLAQAMQERDDAQKDAENERKRRVALEASPNPI